MYYDLWVYHTNSIFLAKVPLFCLMSHKIVMNLYSYASKTIFRNIGETGRPPSSHSSTSLRDSPPFPSPPIHFSLSSVSPRRNGCFLASTSVWSPLMWFLLLLLLRYCWWCCFTFSFSFSFPIPSTIVVSNCRIRQPTTQLGNLFNLVHWFAE